MSFHKNEVQQDNEDLSRLTEFICSQMLSFRGQVVRTTYIHLSWASSICCCMFGVRQCVRCDNFAPQDWTLTQSGSKWLERLGPVTKARQTLQ